MNHDPALTTVRSPAPDRSVAAFWLMLASFVAAWTVAAAWTQPNLPLDSIEMLHWGREWQLGYYKHPPLPAWTAHLTTLLFGSAEWPIYLVAELFAAAGFWAIWRLGRELLPPWHALCTVAALQGCYHFNWSTPDINNNTVTRPFWALAVLLMYWALATGQRRYWLGFGLAMGAGLWSKYDMLCLGAGLAALLLGNRQARQAWRSSGPYLAAAVIALVIAPHVYWLLEHDFITLTYAAERADDGSRWSDHLINPLQFAAKQAPVALPILALLSPIIGLRWRLRALSPAEKLPRDLLLAATVAPAMLVLVLSAVTGARIRTGWTAQFWCYLGVLALYCLEGRPRSAAASHRTLLACGAACAAGLLVMPLHHGLGPLFRGKASRIHFPGAAVADSAEQLWRQVGRGPLPVVASSDWWTAANISFYGDSRASTLNLSAPRFTPWRSDAELLHSGGVLIEPLLDDGPTAAQTVARWQRRFGSVAEARVLSLGFAAPGQVAPARFVIAVAPSGASTTPAKVATSSQPIFR